MTIIEISRLQTVVDYEDFRGSKGCHESIMRSYHILEKAKEYLRSGVPARIILQLIDEMESGDAAPRLVPIHKEGE